MKCMRCGKYDATGVILHTVNGYSEKLYLCDACAHRFKAEHGMGGFDGFDVFRELIGGAPMGLVSSLGGMFDAPKSRALVCPDCNTTSDEFIKTGYVGCPRCYDVFEPIVRETVKKLQQSDMHVGKTPYGEDLTKERESLKSQLQYAVDSGDYTAVSEISRRLEQLKSGGGEGGAL